MGLFHHHKDDYEEVTNAPHKAKLSHQMVAAAASYEAMKAFNEHQEKNGKEVNHAKAKQFLAAAAGVAIDRLIETKGLDAIDRAKAKKQAEENCDGYYDEEDE